MWLKVVIVLLFLALVASLTSGLWYLIKDQGKTRRTWYALSVRLVLAAALIGFLIYGLRSGQLGSHAPWDAYRAEPAEQTAP
jgi:succinate dehydrogenase hydrophobic anchor subunit